jgi:tetratricopeptide (TPR) repeat protein
METEARSTFNSSDFLAENQHELAELLTFVDFAVDLTIGFIELNQSNAVNWLVEALRDRSSSEIQLLMINFANEPYLRFLRDALVQRLSQVQLEAGQKLVLVIQGLETAIGTDSLGDYPPILQDLNFVRDAYQKSVPHPLLLILPDYAISRVIQYAPDFWAWQSGFFRFKTPAQQVAALKVEAFDRPLARMASADNQAQIDQLKQLLIEHRLSGQPIAPQDIVLCSEIYYKIGSAYLTQRQEQKAIDYLKEGLKLAEKQADQNLRHNLLRKLGNAYEQLRQFEQAEETYNLALDLAKAENRLDFVSMLLCDLADIAQAQRRFEPARELYRQSLQMDEARGDRYSQASTYHQLGIVAQELREYDQARKDYQQALEIYIEFGDRYEQAGTYHQLGIVAQALREYDQARKDYQQALQIYIEFGDRYEQAGTYHQLGIVAQELREYDQARKDYQQALEIFIEFGDRYPQASTYYQLAKVAEEVGEIEQAISDYMMDLQITAEFNDQHGLGISLRNLSRFYKSHPSPYFLSQIAQVLGVGDAEVLQLFESAVVA